MYSLHTFHIQGRHFVVKKGINSGHHLALKELIPIINISTRLHCLLPIANTASKISYITQITYYTTAPFVHSHHIHIMLKMELLCTPLLHIAKHHFMTLLLNCLTLLIITFILLMFTIKFLNLIPFHQLLIYIAFFKLIAVRTKSSAYSSS